MGTTIMPVSSAKQSCISILMGGIVALQDNREFDSISRGGCDIQVATVTIIY